MRKHLVISAVNFTEGGPLTVLQEAVESAKATLGPQWRITALVHNERLVGEGVVKLALPQCKRSWVTRLWYEWVRFANISRTLNVDLWMSLHDVTPRVVARRQVVYCHNPAPFYRMPIKEVLIEPKLLVFNRFYWYVYKMLIQRNRFVVVQQEWLRREFSRLVDPSRIVVARPSIKAAGCGRAVAATKPKRFSFFYPALPRVFKNIELLCSAARDLSLARPELDFEVLLTISGRENRYARWLSKRYGGIPQIKFGGRLTREDMMRAYEQASAVVFPSKLETWGLPITEAKSYYLPLLVADLPYGRETVGSYDRVQFFDPYNPSELRSQMEAMVDNRWAPVPAKAAVVPAPFANGWDDTWRLVTEGL